jgi:phospholipid N-methyltransferase
MTALVFAVLVAAGSHAAAPASIDDCEDLYLPDSVHPGKDVVWMPTPDYLVDGMLQLAGLTADDYLIDLGAGDGRIAIAAARDFGATALGIEYDSDFVQLARCMVAVEGVEERVRIVEGDIFVEDFSDATVLTLFLLPELNLCIRHRVLAMRPGTRVVSHHFDMAEWRPDDLVTVNKRIGHLWIVPAQVGGRWEFRDAAGAALFSADLQQRFQDVRGEVHQHGAGARLHVAALRGAAIELRFTDVSDQEATFRGRVTGEVMSGTIERPSAPALSVTGTRVEAFPPGTWADMAPGCERFYAP